MDHLESLPQGTTFVADRVVLFESRLTPRGPTYSIRLDKQLVP
jgi:2'-5' RNA ligase